MVTAPRLRFAHGFRSLPAAFGILSRRPKILLWLLPPLLITLALDLVAFLAAFGWLRDKIAGLMEGRGLSEWLTGAMSIFAGVAVVLLLGWSFGWLFLLLSSPFQDFISAAVERERRGAAPVPFTGFGNFFKAVARGVVQTVVLLMITLPVLVVGFVPAVGPLIVFAWSSFALGFSFVTIPAGRLRDRLRLARDHGGAMMGLGAVGALAAIVPFLNVLCMPVFVVAGTLVYLQATEPLADDKLAAGSE
jgi:uncharacterized protein involved in cysteine biosynthesis